MRILVAIDKFKGSISASTAVRIIQEALTQRLQEAQCDVCPIADGGEGTTEAVVAALSGSWRQVDTYDAQGRPVKAHYGLVKNDLGAEAVMEMSAASGLAMVSDLPLAPATASTFGTGLLLVDAIQQGVRRITIGIGGSATNDGGVGMAAALGYKFLDCAGRELPANIASMNQLASIQRPPMQLPEILVACDVNNPLLGPKGCTQVYGKQKGVADPGFFEERLSRLADIAKRDLGVDARDMPGAGAAGGLGWGLMTFCNATLTSGFDLIAKVIHLEERIRNTDLVITGEGRLDAQTLHGKGPMGVALLAREYNKPVVAFAGSVESENELAPYFAMLCGINPQGLPLAEAMQRGPELLKTAVLQHADNLRRLARRA